MSVLNRGKEGQEDYCLSSTGSKEKGETKKKEKKLVNYKGNGSRNGSETEAIEAKGEKWKRAVRARGGGNILQGVLPYIGAGGKPAVSAREKSIWESLKGRKLVFATEALSALSKEVK